MNCLCSVNNYQLSTLGVTLRLDKKVCCCSIRTVIGHFAGSYIGSERGGKVWSGSEWCTRIPRFRTTIISCKKDISEILSWHKRLLPTSSLSDTTKGKTSTSRPLVCSTWGTSSECRRLLATRLRPRTRSIWRARYLTTLWVWLPGIAQLTTFYF